MNTQHTPGPLHNVTGARPGPWIRQVLNDESEAYIHDKHCNAIARVYSLSDAALIAAAPAMYEALSHAAMSNHHPACKCKGEYSANPERYCTCHVQKAKAALAQAEGR